MTDKLAEALHWYNDLSITEPYGSTLWQAARSYHAMPVVDVSLVKREEDRAGTLNDARRFQGWNDCIDHLRATYPDGLRWEDKK